MPRNGNTTARGYGWRDHQARRKQLAPHVAAGGYPCRRCGHPIAATSPGHTCLPGCRSPACWDLGHDDHDRTLPTMPEHRHPLPYCQGNRGAAARAKNQGHRRDPLSLVQGGVGVPPPEADRW
jgi:hypothetical protein